MEKPADADALRVEYLELLKIMYGTARTGFNRVKAHMDVSFFGMLITQGALLGAFYFMDDLDQRAVVAILVIVVLATLWWFSTLNKELSKHEEVKREYEVMEKRLKCIEREYRDLTGTELRGSFTAAEIGPVFEPLLKKRKS
jgi:hypothetical protein